MGPANPVIGDDNDDRSTLDPDIQIDTGRVGVFLNVGNRFRAEEVDGGLDALWESSGWHGQLNLDTASFNQRRQCSLEAELGQFGRSDACRKPLEIVLRLLQLVLGFRQQGFNRDLPGRLVRASTREDLSQIGQLSADTLSESEYQPATLSVGGLKEPPTGPLEVMEMPADLRLKAHVGGSQPGR